MKKYVLGFDGGGTKTHCVIFDTEGNKVDFVEWGTTNHEVLDGGFDQLKIEFKNLLDHILTKNNIKVDELENCVFGVAGYDTKEQGKIISEIISGYGIKKFLLCNDAVLGVMAGSPNGYGICAINGTGFCVAGINKEDKVFQIGGMGETTGDWGGGTYIGETALRYVYNYLFKCGRKTMLKDFIFERFEITSKYEYPDRIAKAKDNNEQSKVSREVFRAALLGDEVSLEILVTVGKELASAINGMVQELDFNEDEVIDVVLAGSINVKGEHPIMVDTLKNEVINKYPNRKFNFIKLYKPPVFGAVVHALGISEKDELFKKVESQF